MNIAVIGGGVTGMAVAHALQQNSDVTVFEAQARLGGHSDTHNLLVDGRSYAIDSGFIAFNERNYPQFSGWLASLGVATRRTNMSFGVSVGSSDQGAHYGTADLSALFSERRNLINPRFLRMLLDVGRFYRESRKLNGLHQRATLPSASLTLGDYLTQRNYSPGFIEDHILPLCVALWSTTVERARELPLAFVLDFMDRHHLLQFEGRPDWLVVEGGSNRYVSAFVDAFKGDLRLSSPVLKVERNPGFVRLRTREGEHRFDRVVFACHADQALSLIDPSPQESEILGAFHYNTCRAVVHSDESFMPTQSRAWSSWNVLGNDHRDLRLTLWLNRLQSLGSDKNFFVTLDPAREPAHLWAERSYQHPVFTLDVQRAQQRRSEINGQNSSYFAGAYWGFGTHEDGFVSGMEVIAALGVTPQIAVSA